MRRIILSAMLLLPSAGMAQTRIAQGAAIPCDRAFQMTWVSQPERGYFSNHINLQNTLNQPVSMTHRFNGPGAMGAQDTVVDGGRSGRRVLSRTQGYYPRADLIAATTLTCVAR